jgi:hypothetical protein
VSNSGAGERPGSGRSPASPAAGAEEALDLLLRLTEKNGRGIALVYPGESADYVRGFIDGSIDALRLALDHLRDIAARHGEPCRRIGKPGDTQSDTFGTEPGD